VINVVCKACGSRLHEQAEKAIGSGETQIVWADTTGEWICERTGGPHINVEV